MALIGNEVLYVNPIIDFQLSPILEQTTTGDIANLAGETGPVVFRHSVSAIEPGNSPFFSFDPNQNSPTTANAQFLFTPILSTASSDAIFVYPQIGSFTNSSGFAAAYNLKWGDTGSAIPAGTQVCLGGFEANITTNQTFSDTSGGFGDHLFGGSFVINNGTEAQGIALTADINNVAVTYYGADINVNNNVSGGHVVGYTASSNGSHPALTAFEITGNWTNSLDLDHLPIINAQKMVTTTRFELDGGLTYFYGNTPSVFPDTTINSSQAGAIGWNYTNGSAETDFWNMYTTAPAAASFIFWQMDSSSSATQVALFGKTLAQINAPLQLSSTLQLGTAFVGTPVTSAGYITVLDSGGIVRKLMIGT